MDGYLKRILIAVSLLHLISYSYGHRPFRRASGVPVACGSVLEVTPQTKFAINSQMLSNFRGHVIDRNPFKNAGIGRYLKTKAVVESRKQIPLDLPQRNFPQRDLSDKDDGKIEKPRRRSSSFLSRNNLNPVPEASLPFSNAVLNIPSRASNNNVLVRKEPKENLIVDVPSRDNFNYDDLSSEMSSYSNNVNDRHESYFPKETRPQREAPPAPSPRIPARGPLNLYNNADVQSSLNINPPTNNPFSALYPESNKKVEITRPAMPTAPPKPKPRFNLDDIFGSNANKPSQSPYAYLRRKKQVSSEESDDQTPVLSQTTRPFQSPYSPPVRDSFDKLKVKAQPSLPSFVPTPSTPSPKKETSTPGLPPYIQRLLEAKKGKDPLSRVNSNQAPPQKESKSSGNVDAVNPQDILQSLGPEKIEQLRQLLNSAAGPYGPSLKDSNTELLRTFSDQRQRFRSRRRRDIEQVSEEPDKCIATFKKGKDCEKLIVRIQHWIDNVKDCEQEYLLIQDDQQLERRCGINENNNPVRISGNKVTVEHFLKSAQGKINFAGVVECES